MSQVRKPSIEILHGPPVGRIRETTPPRQRRSEKLCGPLIGGWVERDLNSEDIPLTRRCNFVGETEEVESVMYPAVLSKLRIMGRRIRLMRLALSQYLWLQLRIIIMAMYTKPCGKTGSACTCREACLTRALSSSVHQVTLRALSIRLTWPSGVASSLTPVRRTRSIFTIPKVLTHWLRLVIITLNPRSSTWIDFSPAGLVR